MEKKEKTRYKYILVGFIKDLVIAAAIVLVINTFFAQSLRVEGHSMAPTMQHGDIVLMNKLIYHFTDPQVGDIVGFYAPTIEKRVVKRIIAVEGDRIDYKNNMLYKNDNPIIENIEYGILDKGDIIYPITIPENTYFVIGDHSNQSIDSRYQLIGLVPSDAVEGRIRLRLLPFGTAPVLK